jgi:hypothetical protein
MLGNSLGAGKKALRPMASGMENPGRQPRWLRILLDPRMQQKLCLSLVLVVLFGALALGNPFLPCGSAAPAAGGSTSPAAAAAASSPAESSLAASSLTAAAPAAATAGAKAAANAVEARLVGAGEAAPSVPIGVPALAVAPRRGAGMVALRTEPAIDRRVWPACPDPELANLVIAVAEVGGQTVWELQDGRRLVRNPIAGTLPLLVPFGDGN